MFDHESQGSDGTSDGRSYDYGEMLDELRCHTSESVELVRLEAVAEQRWWHLRELAALRVLDERGKVNDSQAGKDGTRTRDIRRKRATAKNLAKQPKLANAAAKGKLSEEQLAHASALAGEDPDEDERWAEDAPDWSPEDLAKKVREQRTPTAEVGAARRAARELRFWWRQDHGMLDGRFSLPDIDGAIFESVVNEMIGRMRPVKGQPWDTREHRGADALVELCRSYAARRGDEASGAPAPHLIVQVPLHGPATVAGVPLPDAMVERLRAQAKVEPVLVDDDGEPIIVGRVESVLSEKTKRVVRQRDGKCRWPGCDQRVGLEVHHLWPSSWDGPDELWNLAAVCWHHHHQLAPQGRWLLLGNPNNPAGLSLIDRDDLPRLATLAADQARAGPSAA